MNPPATALLTAIHRPDTGWNDCVVAHSPADSLALMVTGSGPAGGDLHFPGTAVALATVDAIAEVCSGPLERPRFWLADDRRAWVAHAQDAARPLARTEAQIRSDLELTEGPLPEALADGFRYAHRLLQGRKLHLETWRNAFAEALAVHAGAQEWTVLRVGTAVAHLLRGSASICLTDPAPQLPGGAPLVVSSLGGLEPANLERVSVPREAEDLLVLLSPALGNVGNDLLTPFFWGRKQPLRQRLKDLLYGAAARGRPIRTLEAAVALFGPPDRVKSASGLGSTEVSQASSGWYELE